MAREKLRGLYIPSFKEGFFEKGWLSEFSNLYTLMTADLIIPYNQYGKQMS
jgi:hypothetical protein